MTLMKILVCTQKKNYELSHRQQPGLHLEKYYYTVKKETPRQQ